MVRLLKRLLRSEKGQALPIVLALLAIGGLVIVPSLNFASSSLNISRAFDEGMKGAYAADAAVEHVLWSLVNGETSPTQLPENINRMTASIETIVTANYTLYLGELIEPGQHFDYLDVDTDIVDEDGYYTYTITVTWMPESGYPDIKLKEVGARMPIGYTYIAGSADNFTENLSTEEPDTYIDTHGAYMLNWVLEPPLPSVSDNETVKTQAFYITGEGDLEGDYAWVVANRSDIGATGEIVGELCTIIATATRPEDGRATAKIVADVMISNGTIYILSWQISKQ